MSHKDYGFDKPFDKYLVAELKTFLEARSLSSRGVKNELIERLKTSLKEEKQQKEEEQKQGQKQSSPNDATKQKSDESVDDEETTDRKQKLDRQQKQEEEEDGKKRKDYPENINEESSKKRQKIENAEKGNENQNTDNENTKQTSIDIDSKKEEKQQQQKGDEKNENDEVSKMNIFICISGLKRPFPLPELKQKLQNNTSFWLNSIKSCCIASFNTKSSATNAFNEFHQKVWPQDPHNKTLDVKYISESERATIVKNDGKIEEVVIEQTDIVKENVTVNDLDQIFKFTKCEPKIYYLPNTDEQIKEKKLKEERNNNKKNGKVA